MSRRVMLRLVASNPIDDLPKPMALKFERVELRPREPLPVIAVQAARLARFRPDVAALFESLFDDLLAEIVPPDRR